MDLKIKREIINLQKLGIPENIAVITACSMNLKPELASQSIIELIEEQNELKEILQMMIPFTMVIKSNIEETIWCSNCKESNDTVAFGIFKTTCIKCIENCIEKCIDSK